MSTNHTKLPHMLTVCSLQLLRSKCTHVQ